MDSSRTPTGSTVPSEGRNKENDSYARSHDSGQSLGSKSADSRQETDSQPQVGTTIQGLSPPDFFSFTRTSDTQK
ncbi:hypothetical protein HZ326_8409 [Fusarium oxysporum f. sp. albedinis]|nr:hypothetical protein HZ326_8409 [Fusarium oxysporum f. sp. albedinis]